MDEVALTTALAAEEAAEAALAAEAVLSESEDEAAIAAAQHDANGGEDDAAPNAAPPGSTRAPRKRKPAPKRGAAPSRAPTDGAQDDASLADALGAMELASAEAPATAPRPKGRKTATASDASSWATASGTIARAEEAEALCWAEAEPAVSSALPVSKPRGVINGVINVHLLASDGRELQVKCRTTTKLHKLQAAFCMQFGLAAPATALRFRGAPLALNTTPFEVSAR